MLGYSLSLSLSLFRKKETKTLLKKGDKNSFKKRRQKLFLFLVTLSLFKKNETKIKENKPFVNFLKSW
jgi:hypothetical protein